MDARLFAHGCRTLKLYYEFENGNPRASLAFQAGKVFINVGDLGSVRKEAVEIPASIAKVLEPYWPIAEQVKGDYEPQPEIDQAVAGEVFSLANAAGLISFAGPRKQERMERALADPTSAIGRHLTNLDSGD